MSNFEYRTCVTELRVADEAGQPPRITGYASVFGERSQLIPPGFVEIIQRGAFKKVLDDGQDVRALVEHDLNQMLGRRGSGTLKLWEDDRGLRVEIVPPNTEVGRTAIELVRRGDIAGMSFGFRADNGDEWNVTSNPPTRTVKNVTRLRDVSVVVDPAYTATTAEVRSHVEELLGTGGEQASDSPETTGNEIDEELERRLNYYDALLLERTK